MRPGYGLRHPALAPLLQERTPSAVVEFSWLDGALPLRASNYTEVAQLPEELISSVRCLVLVGDQVVVCDTPDGCHPWPGGRREPGESFVETACREVRRRPVGCSILRRWCPSVGSISSTSRRRPVSGVCERGCSPRARQYGALEGR